MSPVVLVDPMALSVATCLNLRVSRPVSTSLQWVCDVNLDVRSLSLLSCLVDKKKIIRNVNV